MAGLYLHIPFCQAICHYCNFTRGLVEAAVQARYVDALATDIARHAGDAAIDSIYLGGGTPSVLTGAQVARLVRTCREAFAVASDAEITMEANPESVSEASAAAFLEAGVTRVSLGVQSFRDDELARLGRLHSAARAAQAVADLRRAGADNVSLDLMLWLPDQRPGHLRESIARLVDLAPEHASVYLLEIYPQSPLREAMARSGWSVAPDDDAADMYLDTMSALEAAGYRQYEISNVARPGRESRHNLTYWRDGNWLAFGAGAHGADDTCRWRVVSGTGDYIARVDRGDDTVAERWPRDGATRCEEALFMGLRLVEGLDLPRFRARYGLDVWGRYGEALEPFVRAGHLVHQPGRRISLTRPGMLVANDAMAVFLDAGMR